MKQRTKLKLGRKTLLNPALRKKLCVLLADANTIAASCAACGLGVSTYHEWRSKNPDFADATTRARGLAQMKLIKEIRRCSRDDWRAFAWLAERMFPAEFARTADRQLETEPDKPLGVSIVLNTGKSLKELTDFPVVPAPKADDDVAQKADDSVNNGDGTDDEDVASFFDLRRKGLL